MPVSNGADVKHLIEKFGLMPHPEGGYYRETHRDATHVMRVDAMSARSPRAASTCIYYLLCDDAYSAWHRIDADEAWHFYAGDPLNVHVLDGEGRLVTHRLGNALEDGDAVFQAVVPAGCWFAAQRAAPADHAAGFALVGCTVAPGFEFEGFELADVPALTAAYPQHADILARLAPRPSAQSQA
jgi:uncharacterized protein